MGMSFERWGSLTKPQWMRQGKYRFDRFRRYLRFLGFFAGLEAFMKLRILPWNGRRASISYDSSKIRFSIRREMADVITFEQTLIWRDYDIEFTSPIMTILDCGANIGCSPIYFAERFPNAEILAVEPEKANFELLSNNTTGWGGVKLLNAAVWRDSTTVSLVNPGATSNSFRFSDSAGLQSGQVDGFDIPYLMARQGWDHIDIVKLDIEGAEYALFSGDYKRWLDRISVLIVEIHESDSSTDIRAVLEMEPFAHFVQGENDIYVRADDRRAVGCENG